MESSLQEKVDLFIDTLGTLKKEYKWSIGDLSMRSIALVYVLANKTFDKDTFDETVNHIKQNSKWTSYYRGHQMHSTAALLITKFDAPKQAFARLLEYDEKMKAGGFKNSPYLPIASYALLLTCDDEHVEYRVKKAMELYTEMKKNHYWLTSSDDYPIAVLLAGSDSGNDALVSEMESNYDMLHQEGFSRSNGLQFLSHLLTFTPGSAQEKAARTRHIYETLKQEKLNVSSMYYGILGYLSLLGESADDAAYEAIDVADYLKQNKNFKWGYRDMNVLAASSLVANQYVEKLKDGSGLIETGIGISVEAMIAAQTAALIAATSAAVAASTASTAGN